MPAFQNIVLADGQTTPANHTFVPVSLNENQAVWYDRALSVQASQPYMTAKLTAAKGQTGVSRVNVSLAVPLYDNVNGKLVNTVRGSIELLIPGSSTQAQRDNIAAYIKNLAAHATVQSMIKGPEGIY